MARLIAGVAAGQPFADPEAVSAVGRVGETGVDEWAAANLTFPGGVSAHVVTGIRKGAENVVRVVGSEGYLVVPNPWLPARDGSSAGIEVHRVGEDDRHVEVETVPLYAAEADTVAAHLADRQAPAMTWADSLGQAATLDAWRAAIGLEYPSERLDANRPTVHRRPLRRRDDHTMKYGQIVGVDKQVSRLVMGVDNQHEPLATAPRCSTTSSSAAATPSTPATSTGEGSAERCSGSGSTTAASGTTSWSSARARTRRTVTRSRSPGSCTSRWSGCRPTTWTSTSCTATTPRCPVGEFVDVLNEHYRAGRIKAFGGSNWTLERIAEANAYAEANGRQGFMVAVSNNFSLARALDVPGPAAWPSAIRRVRAVAGEERRLPLLPWSSQARGLLHRSGRARGPL